MIKNLVKNMFFIIFSIIFIIFSLKLYFSFKNYFDNEMESVFSEILKSENTDHKFNLLSIIDNINPVKDGYACILMPYEKKLRYKNDDIRFSEFFYEEVNKNINSIDFRSGFFGVLGSESSWALIIFDKNLNNFKAYEISINKIPLLGLDGGNCFYLNELFVYKEFNKKKYDDNQSVYGLIFSSNFIKLNG